MDKVVFDLLYIGGLFSIFVIFGFITSGLLYIAYRFIPCFREWCDKFVESLPEWEEVEYEK